MDTYQLSDEALLAKYKDAIGNAVLEVRDGKRATLNSPAVVELESEILVRFSSARKKSS